ncbi:ABC transporter ATP-binding protein [Caviibacter abscessus]|uniref:ABC transporter ATP-binding protein n=1 Tax=Caviibacter abscessus TaxID=1766719 RepID=UPI0008321955|nr:ABC transporter ATP-binding protein [Caviibacter abscessus]
MKKINLINMTSIYSNKKGIKNVTLSINEGEFVAILGHNGAGKSTFLNSLMGIKDYNEGEISIDYKYNEIGFISQKQVIDWYLNVESNIRMEEIFLPKRDDNLFNKITELLELKPYLNNSIEDLSGGQLQRVQISRAIMKKPKLYILDEPTTGLDVYSSEKVMQYFKDEVAKNKIVLVSSHDLELIQKFCDRIIYIYDGNIKYDGPINEFIKDDSLRDKILKELSYE